MVGANITQKNPQSSHVRMRSGLISASLRISASARTVAAGAPGELNSGEPDLVHGLEALPPIVGEHDPQRPLPPDAQLEGDQRVVAERRRHGKPAHTLVAVKHGQLTQIERLSSLDELAVADCEARAV